MHFFQTKDGAKHRKRYLGLNPPFDLNVHIRVQHGLSGLACRCTYMQVHLVECKSTCTCTCANANICRRTTFHTYIRAHACSCNCRCTYRCSCNLRSSMTLQVDLESRCTCVGVPNFAPKRLRSFAGAPMLGALGAPA